MTDTTILKIEKSYQEKYKLYEEIKNSPLFESSHYIINFIFYLGCFSENMAKWELLNEIIQDVYKKPLDSLPSSSPIYTKLDSLIKSKSKIFPDSLKLQEISILMVKKEEFKSFMCFYCILGFAFEEIKNNQFKTAAGSILTALVKQENTKLQNLKQSIANEILSSYLLYIEKKIECIIRSNDDISANEISECASIIFLCLKYTEALIKPNRIKYLRDCTLSILKNCKKSGSSIYNICQATLHSVESNEFILDSILTTELQMKLSTLTDKYLKSENLYKWANWWEDEYIAKQYSIQYNNAKKTLKKHIDFLNKLS